MDQLPSVSELPNPFIMENGSLVRTRDDWSARRRELTDLILYYQYGTMPPAPGNVRGEELLSRTDASTGATEKQVALSMGPGWRITCRLELTIPQGSGPFPAIIRGDLCWGRVKPEIRNLVISRGYVLAEFNRTDFAPDNAQRDAGVYPHYPGYDWGALAAWAWGFHRVVDYLETQPYVDRTRICVTGHSRGGKAALLAGATDQRIALTNPNNSGCGGAGCYRFQAEKSERIEDILRNFPFWFAPRFREFISRVDRLPFDQHSLKALVAPRALLTTEALGDLWANPEGTQQTHLAAREVYRFLGVPDRIGIYFRKGGHEHNLDDWMVLLDFADWQLFGKKVERSFDRLAFPQTPRAFSWSAP